MTDLTHDLTTDDDHGMFVIDLPRTATTGLTDASTLNDEPFYTTTIRTPDGTFRISDGAASRVVLAVETDDTVLVLKLDENARAALISSLYRAGDFSDARATLGRG